MQKLRVIQWTTGKVGKMSLRAILDDPRLELVGKEREKTITIIRDALRSRPQSVGAYALPSRK